MPLTKKAAPIVQDVVASATKVEATTHRSTTSEIPAVPVGNIENRRCTLDNVAVAVCGCQSVRLVGRLYFRLTARRGQRGTIRDAASERVFGRAGQRC